jgi:18S rRNA (guanine1575-N7)-methyltransferase
MLEVAQEREVEGGLIHYDMGHGCPFRPGVFDGAISISAVQWLCNADNSAHEPRRRLKAFFTQLYRCLKRGAKAVLQFYPDGAKQAEMITTAALRVGFSGGLVVDYPNSTRAKKYFLVLAAGPPEVLPTARQEGDGLDEEIDGVRMGGRSGGSNKRQKKGHGKHARTVFVGSKRHPEGKGKEWIKRKKEQARNRGKDTARDSKYTGRKRKERI